MHSCCDIIIPEFQSLGFEFRFALQIGRFHICLVLWIHFYISL
jgi:hypothetical protein